MEPTQDDTRDSYDRVAKGFALEEVIERDPYPEVEYQRRRAYIFARKP